MTTRIYVDRSRVEEYQSCPRRRFLVYHQNGMGIVSIKKSLPLAYGGSVHEGLAFMLREGQRYMDSSPEAFSDTLTDIVARRSLEQAAVDLALADFSKHRGKLDTVVESKQEISELDEYLFTEQSSLLEGQLRAYARRRLKPLLTQYEVVEVEREGEWRLAEACEGDLHHPACNGECYKRGGYELWFMSRPDALLRDRESNQLFLLSFKTTGSWDHRKEKDAQHDMQGLSEGVEVERRLGEWWQRITYEAPPWAQGQDPKLDGCSPAVFKYLRTQDAAPRILGIRYEYLLKGERWKDPGLTAKFQTDVWSQRSHLIRGYLNSGMASGDEQWNWSFGYLKPDGSKSKLYAKNWPSVAVTDHMTVEAWINKLDDADIEINTEMVDREHVRISNDVGYSCSVQATGVTAEHPLDAVFVAPFIVYRSDDDLRDLIEQIESQERRVADGVAEVNAATDEGERRSALNRHFVMNRHSCTYPWPCQFEKVCYGGEEIRRDPLASGLYQIRVPNHPVENGATDETSR